MAPVGAIICRFLFTVLGIPQVGRRKCHLSVHLVLVWSADEILVWAVGGQVFFVKQVRDSRTEPYRRIHGDKELARFLLTLSRLCLWDVHARNEKYPRVFFEKIRVRQRHEIW